MRVLYPSLNEITRNCRMHVLRTLQSYLSIMNVMKYGNGPEILETLERAGVLKRPPALKGLEA
jgi:hypothetical protein